MQQLEKKCANLMPKRRERRLRHSKRDNAGCDARYLWGVGQVFFAHRGRRGYVKCARTFQTSSKNFFSALATTFLALQISIGTFGQNVLLYNGPFWHDSGAIVDIAEDV